MKNKLLYVLIIAFLFFVFNSTWAEEMRGGELQLQLKTDREGMAQGVVTLKLTNPLSEKYTVYYADRNEEPLDEYAPIFSVSANLVQGTALFEYEFLNVNALPEKAARMMAVGENDTYVARIPQDNRIQSEKLYSFGLMSDTHCAGYYSGEDPDGWVEEGAAMSNSDYKRAIKYFNRMDTAFNIIAGDVTKDGTEGEFRRYAELKEKSNAPVYHAAGNHDRRNDGEQDPSMWERFVEPNGSCFTYLHGEDVYLFLSVVNADCDLDDETLAFMEQELERYRDQRVFIVEHAYVNPVGNAAFMDPHGDRSVDNQRFLELLQEYPGVTLITGHSHLHFDFQAWEKTANCAWASDDMCHRIHVPSLASPRCYSPVTGEVSKREQGSAAYIVDVYETYTVFRGIDFEGCEEGEAKLLPYAQYIIPYTQADGAHP